MARSTQTEKDQRLNTAFDLLARNFTCKKAAEVLVKQFDLSWRQAYRYLQEAESIPRPVEVSEPTFPITLKLPGKIVDKLRAYAQASGMTMGETVARALSHYLAKVSRRG